MFTRDYFISVPVIIYEYHKVSSYTYLDIIFRHNFSTAIYNIFQHKNSTSNFNTKIRHQISTQNFDIKFQHQISTSNFDIKFRHDSNRQNIFLQDFSTIYDGIRDLLFYKYLQISTANAPGCTYTTSDKIFQHHFSTRFFNKIFQHYFST